MRHLKEKWFQSSLEAHNKGMGKIYAFGSLALREHHRKFFKDNHNKVEKFDRYYKPNPFLFQYDLLIYCWIHYRTILNDEVVLLRKKRIQEGNEAYDDAADEIVATNTLYGMSRADFIYGACELRWPSALMDGSYRGPLVRDPWMEEKVEAFSDEKYKYIIAFGGGGQGKTLTTLALNLLIWDYYMFTQKGARCMISTVSKGKLDSAAWSYLQQLLLSTEKEISSSAGQGVIAGDHTIKRPGIKDVAGVYKGILLGDRIDDASIIDKLTGSHGHPYIGYIMDEMQSTPEAPITSSSNYTMHAGDFRIFCSGNYSEDTDTLGRNAKPSTGWDSVSEDTKKWMSYLVNHQPAIVLHFSNERSPGMAPEGAKMFPYLPNADKLKKLYPNKKSRTIENKQFRRFWLGWRIINAQSDTVITKTMISDTGCDKPLKLKSMLHRFFSFDSAQGEGDRNLLGEFEDGIEEGSNQRVFGPTRFDESIQTSETLLYYTESAAWIAKRAKNRHVKSGSMILDWTGRPAQAEMLHKVDFETKQFIFHQAIPDGVKTDPKTKRVGRRIEINGDHKNRLFAHEVATNMMSLGGYLLREYSQAGRIRGMNDNMLEFIDHKGLDEEMFSRKYYDKVSTKYGELFSLTSKKEFKNQYGFSPDLFDVWIMAAYYMFVHRHLPISPITGDNELVMEDLEVQEEMDMHRELYTYDELPD